MCEEICKISHLSVRWLLQIPHLRVMLFDLQIHQGILSQFSESMHYAVLCFYIYLFYILHPAVLTTAGVQTSLQNQKQIHYNNSTKIISYYHT